MLARSPRLSAAPPALAGPLASRRLRRELPALAGALDGERAGAALQRLMVDGSAGYLLEQCSVEGAVYRPGEGCLVRYRLRLVDAQGVRSSALVNAVLLPTRAQAAAHLARLAPLAAAAAGRPALRPFRRAAALLEPWPLAASAFPVDGALPTLVAATDPARLARLLAPAASCLVTPLRYGRGHRCLLRYDVRPPAGEPFALLGKVAADRSGAGAHTALTALPGLLAALPARLRFRVPGSPGYVRGLRLLLLEALPGEPLLSHLLHGDLAHTGPREEAGAAAERCAEIAAGLHATAFAPAALRGPAREPARLRAAAAALEPDAPQLAAWLRAGLARADALLAASPAGPPAPSHGDFKHNQVLLGGGERALVDLDTVCRAEPALDLGHFCAYLRLKAATHTAAAGAADELCERFLAAYADAAGVPAAPLRRRAAAYEALSLLERGLHSWQKFKPERLALIASLLEERLA